MKLFKKEKKYHEDIEDQKSSLVGKESNELAELALDGLDCDSLPNARGDFGNFFRNPIVTNGIIGTLIYFGKLVVEDTKQGIIFHRLGSINNIMTEIGEIDIYEIVDESGQWWDILFVDMYHPRRTNKVPLGYYLKEYDKENGDENKALGSYKNCNKFPIGMPSVLISDNNQKHQQVEETIKSWIKNKIDINPPPEHQNKIKTIMEMLNN